MTPNLISKNGRNAALDNIIRYYHTILVSIRPVVEEKSCHNLNMNDKEKRSIL